MAFALRDYQQRADAAIRALIRAEVRRIVLQAATGAGKTSSAAWMILGAIAKAKRVLFLAHRKELLDQPYRKLTEECDVPPGAVSVVRASDPRYNPLAPVQIASVQTLARRGLPPADLVIADECHRAMGPQYQALLEAFPGAVHLGLTATPSRLDGKGLRGMYQAIVVAAQPSELVAGGWLAEPDVYTVPEDFLPNTQGVRTVAGDYNPRQLAAAANQTKIIGRIAEHLLEKRGDRRTLVFAVDIAGSRRIVESLRARGMRAEHLDGATDETLRQDLLDRLADGDLDVLSSVGILCEGLDIPAIKCVVMARPTQSLTMYLQQVGRMLRPWQGVTPLLLDHAGNVRNHGLPTNDREFDLDGRVKQLRNGRPLDDGEDPIKTCPGCFGIVDADAAVCPYCLRELGARKRVLREEDGELVRLTREGAAAAPPRAPAPKGPRLDATDAEREKRFAQLNQVRGMRNLASDWAIRKYEEEFGEAPRAMIARRVDARARARAAAKATPPLLAHAAAKAAAAAAAPADEEEAW